MPVSDSNAAEPPRSEGGGRRERNKAEKLQRIKTAAYDLFVREGYDHTTTARIAAAADIGMSTLFFYAEDKRDLLFLIFNEWFGGVLDKIEKSRFDDANMVDALVRLFHPLYQHHSKAPILSRATLRELNFFSSGKHSRTFVENTKRLHGVIERIVRSAIERGSVAAEIDPELAVAIIFATYQAEIRRFVAIDEGDVDQAVERLRRMFEIIIGGFSPPKGFAVSSSRSARS